MKINAPRKKNHSQLEDDRRLHISWVVWNWIRISTRINQGPTSIECTNAKDEQNGGTVPADDQKKDIREYRYGDADGIRPGNHGNIQSSETTPLLTSEDPEDCCTTETTLGCLCLVCKCLYTFGPCIIDICAFFTDN